MDLITRFIARYHKEYDFYDQAAKLVAQILERNLRSGGIRAIVTYRAKDPSRLEEKVRQRNAEKKYRKIDTIYKDIADLAGVRVALYFPGEREQVGKVVEELFTLYDNPKEFPGKSAPTYKKRFSGYWATHYRVRLRESSLNEAQMRFCDALVEIQVASVLMHAWAEVEHDLVYKPLQGRLSEDEYAILDELNGLVMSGEIALERLQKSGEARVAQRGRKFENHYDLAAYLLNKVTPMLKGPAPEVVIGRIDVLYDLLTRLDLATPDNLDPYLATITGDTEHRPLSQQIIDQILSEDSNRYEIYKQIRIAKDKEVSFLSTSERLAATDMNNVIGHFISKWIEFERHIRHVANKKFQSFGVGYPTTKLISKLEIFDKEMMWEIDRIRRLRNNLVHGIKIPNSVEINDAAERLDSIIKKFEKELL